MFRDRYPVIKLVKEFFKDIIFEGVMMSPCNYLPAVVNKITSTETGWGLGQPKVIKSIK